MHLIFMIGRLNLLRRLAPLIDEALQQNIKVTCWLDYGHPKTGQKGYEFPCQEKMPAYPNGTPEYVATSTPEQFKEFLSSNTGSIMVGTMPCPYGLYPDLATYDITYYILQAGGDAFLLGHREDWSFADAILGHTEAWCDIFKSMNDSLPPEQKHHDIDVWLKDKFVPAGWPQMDQQSLIDPDAVRAKFGLPKGRDIITFLTFPYSLPSVWSTLFGASTPALRLAKLVRQRKFAGLPKLFSPLSDKAVVKAIGDFAERNNALLLVKGREKNKLPAYLRKRADLIVMDPSQYPATIMEVLSITSLLIHYNSTAALEAGYFGVPSISLDYYQDDPYIYSAVPSLRGIYTKTPGMLIYNTPGVSTSMTVADFIDRFPTSSFSDWSISQNARHQYIETFIGPQTAKQSTYCLKQLVADAKQRNRAT